MQSLRTPAILQSEYDRLYMYAVERHFTYLEEKYNETKEEYISGYSDFLNRHGVMNFRTMNVNSYCFASSPWRPHTEDKRMVLEHTHGLFIT